MDRDGVVVLKFFTELRCRENACAKSKIEKKGGRYQTRLTTLPLLIPGLAGGTEDSYTSARDLRTQGGGTRVWSQNNDPNFSRRDLKKREFGRLPSSLDSTFSEGTWTERGK